MQALKENAGGLETVAKLGQAVQSAFPEDPLYDDDPQGMQNKFDETNEAPKPGSHWHDPAINVEFTGQTHWVAFTPGGTATEA